MPNYKRIGSITRRLFMKRSRTNRSNKYVELNHANTDTDTDPDPVSDSVPDRIADAVQTYSEADEYDYSEYLSDISDSSDDEEDNLTFFRQWSLKHCIKRNALSELLKFLKRRKGFSDLPSDSRTLLKTPKHRNVISLPPGNYCHIGLVRAIDHYIAQFRVTPVEVMMDVNIDGVPLSRSTSNCFWLILVKLFEPNCMRTQKVFVVGVYHGNQKPKDFYDFLMPLINEINHLDTYTSNNISVSVKLRCVVCDAPARNSCLANKSYTVYFGCGRCSEEGVYENHCITFPECDSLKRTDTSFRNQTQPDHHHSTSPFVNLNIDMIQQFLLEYLHLVCLGVVRKIIGMWLNGDLLARLSSNDINEMSLRLCEFAETQPSEFQRKCRSLKEFSNFK